MVEVLENLNLSGEKALPESRDMNSYLVKDFLKQNHVSDEHLSKNIDEAIQLGAREFTISGGGEPLCKPKQVFCLIRAILKNGASVELVTNGTLLTEQNIDLIMQAGLQTISISIDTANAELLDKRRGKQGTFSRIRSALNKINRRKCAKKISGPRIQFYAVLDEESEGTVDELCEFAIANNVERIHFILRKDRESMCQNTIVKLQNKIRHYSIGTNLDEIQDCEPPNSEASAKYCLRPFEQMVIHANGLVTPCCSMSWGTGDFIQKESLNKIWNGRFFNNVRNEFARGGLPACCMNCKEFTRLKH